MPVYPLVFAAWALVLGGDRPMRLIQVLVLSLVVVMIGVNLPALRIGLSFHRKLTTQIMALMLFEVIFWLAAACVFYTTVAFPLILAAAVRIRSRVGPARGTLPIVLVSIVIAAYNEEACVRELVRLVAGRPAVR